MTFGAERRRSQRTPPDAAGWCGDAVLRPGLLVHVVNLGTFGALVAGPTRLRPGRPAELQLVLSQDTDIRISNSGPPETQDLPVHSLSFTSLAVGQCRQQTVSVGIRPPVPGIWYVGAVADPDANVDELIETNNTRASSSVFFL